MNNLSAKDIKTFDECIKETESGGKGDATRHLMLGNGFSVDLFPDIFNYKQLADKITDERIKSIFKDFDTPDFEYVALKLIESLKVIARYDHKREIYAEVQKDVEKLKQILITVIADSHPADPTTISDNQYESCRNFLIHFKEGKKYTFNYDLILYWVYMHFLYNKMTPLDMDDGFRKADFKDSTITWEIGMEHRQNLSYIHGAMHLFQTNGGKIEKYTWGESGNMSITEQVRMSINNDNKFPIFISEGTAEHKLVRIMGNGYLARSISSLKSIGNNMFIFGHSIRDEDDHIFNIMNTHSKLKRIYISIYGDGDSDTNQVIIRKVNKWKHKFQNREYCLYDSGSAKVWNRYE